MATSTGRIDRVPHGRDCGARSTEPDVGSPHGCIRDRDHDDGVHVCSCGAGWTVWIDPAVTR